GGYFRAGHAHGPDRRVHPQEREAARRHCVSAFRESPTIFAVAGPLEVTFLRLSSPDGTNRLTRRLISDLTTAIRELSETSNLKPLIITGNDKFFSAGADLREIAALNAINAFDFARAGQELMSTIEQFPACTCAAITGYCMGGGLDLALACRSRIA